MAVVSSGTILSDRVPKTKVQEPVVRTCGSNRHLLQTLCRTLGSTFNLTFDRKFEFVFAGWLVFKTGGCPFRHTVSPFRTMKAVMTLWRISVQPVQNDGGSVLAAVRPSASIKITGAALLKNRVESPADILMPNPAWALPLRLLGQTFTSMVTPRVCQQIPKTPRFYTRWPLRWRAEIRGSGSYRHEAGASPPLRHNRVWNEAGAVTGIDARTYSEMIQPRLASLPASATGRESSCEWRSGGRGDQACGRGPRRPSRHQWPQSPFPMPPITPSS